MLFIATSLLAMATNGMLKRNQGNWSGFALMGDYFEQPNLNPNDTVFVESFGYDGQFFYQMSYDPLLLTKAHKKLDSPAYRSQRVIYPALVYVLSFGYDPIKPALMVWVSILAILMGAFFLGKWHMKEDRSPMWALALALNGGVLLCLGRDLSEAVAAGFLVSAFWFHYQKKWEWMALMFSLAVLGREILILVPFILGIEFLLRKQWKALPWISIPGIAFVAWQAYVYWRIGEIPYQAGGGNFAGFGSGLWHYLQAIQAEHIRIYERRFAYLTVAVLLLAFLMLWDRRVKHYLGSVISLALFALMPFFFSTDIWVEPWSYGRVLLPMYALFLVVGAQIPNVWSRIGNFVLLAGFVQMMYWFHLWYW